MEENKKRFVLNYVCIVIVFAFSGAVGYMKPAVQACIDAWPEVAETSVRSLVTLPSLVSTIVMFGVGAVVGRKISYRACIMLGSVFITLGGILPFFYAPSWNFVLGSSALMGAGVGFLGVQNALLIREVPGEKRASYLGYASLGKNLVMIGIYPLVGILADINWRYPFLTYAMVSIVFFAALFLLKETKNDSGSTSMAGMKITKRHENSGREKAKMPPVLIFLFVIQLISITVKYPILTSMSSYVVTRGIGNAALAGTMLSVYTIGGAIIHTFLGTMHKYLKDYVMAISFFLVAISCVLILFVPNIFGLTLGTLICGIGYFCLTATLQLLVGKHAPLELMAFSSTVMGGCNLFGVYMSNYYIELSWDIFGWRNAVESSFLGCLFFFLLCGIVFILFRRQINGN